MTSPITETVVIVGVVTIGVVVSIVCWLAYKFARVGDGSSIILRGFGGTAIEIHAPKRRRRRPTGPTCEVVVHNDNTERRNEESELLNFFNRKIITGAVLLIAGALGGGSIAPMLGSQGLTLIVSGVSEPPISHTPAPATGQASD